MMLHKKPAPQNMCIVATARGTPTQSLMSFWCTATCKEPMNKTNKYERTSIPNPILAKTNQGDNNAKPIRLAVKRGGKAWRARKVAG